MNPSTACIKAIRICVLGAARFGVSPDELARRLELDPSLLADPHVRVPHALFLRAWEEVPALCGDPSFGLGAAELLRDAPFDVVDYVCAQGPTLRQAIERMLRYQRLHHDDAELTLTIADGEARLRLRLRGTACAPRHFSEYVVTTWFLRARALVGPTSRRGASGSSTGRRPTSSRTAGSSARPSPSARSPAASTSAPRCSTRRSAGPTRRWRRCSSATPTSCWPACRPATTWSSA
ncbi:AraC family transcriptional regulator ligand-binding domain-containing protein [Nannocystis pusilla]|uniref:AraC family transcriptional regulator ligand-binding domain-containing protein n=1 Tax=Nannocystis pusilla TaxID=889268 RepID=A0A9X3EIW1_9BACT|nr:AraC family transcriptional regulator ligand-binding domain-containing protein [Nannocystis pusilla]MCY1004059.1 AraC family transcriptional regulator ligand-binding domain-containing protein [Nannocystis pusilla]